MVVGNLELIFALQKSLIKKGIICFVTTVPDGTRGCWKIGDGPNCSGGIGAMQNAFLHAAWQYHVLTETLAGIYPSNLRGACRAFWSRDNVRLAVDGKPVWTIKNGG
jgi:hypothetical protein